MVTSVHNEYTLTQGLYYDEDPMVKNKYKKLFLAC